MEDTLIRDTLAKLRNDALYLSDDATDVNLEIKSLLDNSVTELTRLNIDVKAVALNGLSKDQSKLLQADIITFEVVEVNGSAKALAPKIYLSQTSIDKMLGSNVAGSNNNANSSSLATNSTIYAKENLTINAPNASLINNGSIKAGNDINLNVASLTNKTISFASSDIGGISNVDNLSAATISAKNNLTITANDGDVKNIAANIFANNNLSIAANNGSILNSALVSTNNLTAATISSKNNLSITASNDIKNIASTLSANNQLNLTSTNGNILNSALISTNDANLLASNSDAYIVNSLPIKTIANNAGNLSGNVKSELLGTARYPKFNTLSPFSN